MTRHYADTTGLSIPLGVLRALVRAAQALKTGEEWTAEDDAYLAAAIKWLDGRPIYREEVLSP